MASIFALTLSPARSGATARLRAQVHARAMGMRKVVVLPPPSPGLGRP